MPKQRIALFEGQQMATLAGSDFSCLNSCHCAAVYQHEEPQPPPPLWLCLLFISKAYVDARITQPLHQESTKHWITLESLSLSPPSFNPSIHLSILPLIERVWVSSRFHRFVTRICEQRAGSSHVSHITFLTVTLCWGIIGTCIWFSKFDPITPCAEAKMLALKMALDFLHWKKAKNW